MTISANWYLDGLDLPDEDDPMQAIAELKSNAKIIDVSKTTAEIFEEFSATMVLEAEYEHYSHLVCDMKWTVRGPNNAADWRNPCYDCPEYTTDGEHEARALLCALGRRQNDLLTDLDAARVADALDEALVASYERDMADAEQLVAALL